MTLKISIPSDEALLDYDMEALEASIGQFRKNINSMEQAIADDKVRIASYESMIARKKELEARVE